VLAFVALTVLMTWPLPRHAGSAVQDLGDPLHQIWAIRWVQHQILRDPLHLWDANVAYPFRLSLLFSEPALSTALLAWPVQLVTGNDLLAYNVLFLASFVVLGVGMALLVEEITGSLGAGFLAGVVAAYTPYRFGHLSHLNLLGYGWFPLFLWALLRFARTRRWPYAVAASVCLSVQLLTSDTLAVMTLGMLVLALPFALWPVRRRLSRGFVVQLIVVLAVPLGAFAPDAAARLEVGRVYGFARDLATIRGMSADPRSYVSVSVFNHLWRSVLPHAYPNPLFPGAVAAVGALLGLAFGVRRWPRWTAYAILLAAGGFVLSLGPGTTVAGHSITLPYRLLYDHVPGWTAARDVARFGMVALLGLQLMAGLGFAWTWFAVRRRLPSPGQTFAGAGALLLLATLAVVELRSDVGAVTVPRDPATVAVYHWLGAQPRGAVFELPANGLLTGSLDAIAQVYYSTLDWQPVFAEQTSFLPERYLEFLQAVDDTPSHRSEVDADNVGLLQDIGVRYVVVHHESAPAYDWQQALADADQVPALHRVGDFGNATVFTLDTAGRVPVTYALQAPDAAAPGATFPALLLVTNDNPNMAVTTLGTPPKAIARWTDAAGHVVATQTISVPLPVAVASGLTGELVSATAPREPGHYRLSLSFGALAPTIAAAVAVQAPAAAPDGPALVLRGVSWDSRTYHPGDNVDVRLVWDVRRPLSASYALTAQLLSTADRLFAQQDGYPFDGQLPTTRWESGMTIVQVVAIRVPATAPPGPARLLVALYDPAGPDLPRLTIGLPGDTTAPQGVFGPVSLASP